jgi:hypothetical protein
MVPVAMTPAALTRTSMPPNRSSAVWTIRSGASSAVISAAQLTAADSPPTTPAIVRVARSSAS